MTGVNPSAPGPDDIAAAWRRELPDAPTRSIAVVSAVKEIATRLRRERERELHRRGIDAATLDLLSTLRRAGAPYRLSTRELGDRSLVTAGAITQRVSRAERDGLVARTAGPGRVVLVDLTPAGHDLVESVVASVLAIDEARMPPLDGPELALFEEALVRWRDALRRT